MIRNLKVLGLALVAVFAMSAMAAAAASANQFHSENAGTELTASALANQEFQYEEEGATVVCTNISGTGGVVGGGTTGTSVTFHPVYTGCTIPSIGGSSAEVSFNECDYTFTIKESANTGPAHVNCAGSSSISIVIKLSGSAICTFHIAAQTPNGETDYTNGGSGASRDVTVTPTQTGIKGTKTNNNGFGFLCGGASSSTGTYTGQVTVTGDKSGTATQEGVWVE